MTLLLKPLCDVARINPKFNAHHMDGETLVSFVPMAAVSETLGTITWEEERPLNDVIKGFTPFLHGDILIAKITPCFENGKIALAQLSHHVGFGSTEFHVVRPTPNVLDTRYAYHFRQPRIRYEGESRMTGSAGQRRVPKNFIEALKIPLPPLAEQKRIAAILDEADVLRRKRREALAKLDTLKKSVFLELFGDPVTNPRDWEPAVLAELIDNGPQNGLYKPNSCYGSGTPILRIDAFYDGEITDLFGLKRVEITESEKQLYGLHEDDIIINRVNSLSHLGKSAIVTRLHETTVFESNMMRFSVRLNRLNPHFLIHFLQTKYVKNQILSRAKNAVNQSSINQQDVKDLSILLPPLSIQKEFEIRVAEINAMREKAEPSLSRLETLFMSLQHQAFHSQPMVIIAEEMPIQPCLTLDF